MANNYLQFSFAVDPGSEERKAWIRELLSQVDSDDPSPEFLAIFKGYGDDCEGTSWEAELGFSWELDDVDGLWIYAEENGDTDAVASFLKAFLEFEGGDGAQVGFTYAIWCSRPRINEFSGGAIRVYLDGGEAKVSYCDAYEWLAMEMR